MRKKATFLLGSGASAPFIASPDNSLTTRYLTDRLFCQVSWQDVLDQFNTAKSLRHDSASRVDEIDVGAILCVLKRIRERLERTLRFEKPNFEHMIHLLDKASVYLSAYNYTEYENIDALLFDFWRNADDRTAEVALCGDSDPDGWRYVPFLAREVIARSVLALWDRGEPKIEEGVLATRKFFERLAGQIESVSIYSLNYDPLIYESLKHVDAFSTGFDNKFKSNDFYRAGNVVAFVHGHVGFVPSNDEMLFVQDYLEAQEDRMAGVLDNTMEYFQLGVKGIHHNTYLITGLDKTDAFSRNPFASYIQRFGHDTLDSEYIVLIGLSLNDYHLHSFLTNAIFTSRKKIFFVTKLDRKNKPDREKMKEQFAPSDTSVIFKLYHLFQDSVPADSWDRYVDQLYTSLIDTGVCRLTDHIVLYANGTEQFYAQADIDGLWQEVSPV